MPPLNTNYGYASDALPVGSVADSRFTHTSTCDSALEAIAPGQPVDWLGGIPAAANVPARGIARHTTTLVQTDAGLVTYNIGDVVPLVTFGPVWVNVVGAVLAGQLLFAIISGADKGKFSATASASTTTKATGTSETTLTASGPAILFMMPTAITP